MYQLVQSFNTFAELQAYMATHQGNPALEGAAVGISGVGAGSATPEKRGPGRPPGPAKAAAAAAAAASAVPVQKHSRSEVNAAFQQIKDLRGTPRAKELIQSLGVQKLNDLPEESFDKAFELARQELATTDAAATATAEDNDI